VTDYQLPGLKVCLLSVPVEEMKGSHILVLNFLRVLHPIAEKIFLITGNYPEDDLPGPGIHLMNIRNDPLTNHPKRTLMARASKYVITQLKMSYHLGKIAPKVDVVIFFIGGSSLLLPLLAAKLQRKKTILVTAAAGAVVTQKVYRQSLKGAGGLITSRIVSMLERLDYRLCDNIIVYSPSLVHEFGLERYKSKIFIAREHFLNFDKFKMERSLTERGNLIGYIGRLSQEKGILNLMEAILKVAETRDELTFLIAGDGQLRPQVEEYTNKSNTKVKFVDWIPHDELPEYLNRLRLLILPSYTEGLPNIMLEAMACGTPVLATPVGAVPDVIKDGETGFIMENNAPESITENIIRALNHPNLEQITRNARVLVEKEFTYDAAVERYREILDSLK